MMIEGECLVCKQECEGYCHYECALAYSDAKSNRIKSLMDQYGDDLSFDRKLITGDDLTTEPSDSPEEQH